FVYTIASKDGNFMDYYEGGGDDDGEDGLDFEPLEWGEEKLKKIKLYLYFY
ncbi:unnamed protein product, partial [marine sediment metagenome]